MNTKNEICIGDSKMNSTKIHSDGLYHEVEIKTTRKLYK